MTFNSPYNRQSCGPEEMSPEDEVIRIGYRTTEQQVREFMTAGVQLAKARGEMYMYASEDDDDDDDTPLSPYADDPVDTFNLLRYQQELKQKRQEVKAQNDSEEKETALETASRNEVKESAIPV